MPAVLLRVNRNANGDAIKIYNDIERILEEKRQEWPSSIQASLIRTSAKSISQRLDILTSNGLVGLILVLGLLFIFLGLKTAFWVAMGIPTALLNNDFIALLFWAIIKYDFHVCPYYMFGDYG